MQVNEELLVSYGEQYFKKTRRVRLGVPAEHKVEEEDEDCSDTEAPPKNALLTDTGGAEQDSDSTQPPLLLLKETSL